MPPPINPTGGSSYSQEFNEWRDAFPGSVPVDKGTIQDGVLVDQQAQAYACGTDPEIDAAVCTNGVANPDAGIIEVDLHESAAEVARRTGQTNAPTFQEYTRQWNWHQYTSKGLPVPEPTEQSHAQIGNTFLRERAYDSVQILHNWNHMEGNFRIGSAIGGATVAGVTSFVPAGMFIDNPALLAQGIVAGEVAPMLTSSGGSDGGMGTVVGVGASIVGGSYQAPAAAVEQQTVRLTAREAAALEARVVGGPASTGIVRAESLQNRAIATAENALARGEAGATPLLESGPALTPPSAPASLERGASTSPLADARRQMGAGAATRDFDAAEAAYERIRADSTDVAKIAENTGFNPKYIQQVKDHVFYREHILDRYKFMGDAPVFRRFDASPEIASSWLRLTEGTQTEIDIALLKHETAEAWFMRQEGPSYVNAHYKAEQKYPSPY